MCHYVIMSLRKVRMSLYKEYIIKYIFYYIFLIDPFFSIF